ncbi:MAG: hypothetical protein LBS96_06045 [Oscillospiraceae bacterium]|jgi:hypothetical protein|nr:hypothetical protein [Oscillospiraceae bacterium]
MEAQQLTEALRGLKPKDYDWAFALYSTHKSRDGVQLSWNTCEMRGIGRWIEQLARQLLEKALPDHAISEYSPLLPKEEIGVLERGHELIRDPLREILLGIGNAERLAPEDFVNGVVSKPVGYAFYGVETEDARRKRAEAEAPASEEDESAAPLPAELPAAKEALFLRRANPFLSVAKALLCQGENGEIAESEAPLLKFMPQTDFLLMEDCCFFFAESIQKDFDMESRPAAVCGRRLEQIAQADVVGNFEQLELAALGGKNTRKFLDFDREILEHIAGLSFESRMDFLSTYGITLDAGGKMDTADPEQCELIIDLLCGRSCLDALGRLAVGINIKPRE